MTTPTYSNTLIYPSLYLAIVTISLLVDLPVLYASNINLGNTIQNKFEFEDSINLTNNERDSVYGQISTSNNNLYVVWQESVPGSNTRNYDILFKHSTDNGKSFSKEINLSSNMGFSEHPQISSVADNVHIIWADNTNGNKQVYFKTSNDNGNTFGETINLSDNSSSSFNQDVAAFGNNVYAVWVEKTISGPYQMMLAVSEDGGKNFKDSISLSENADEYSYPRISALNGNVYVTWNAGDPPNANTGGVDEGVFFISSSNNGLTFDNISKLNVEENGFGKPQVAAGYDNAIYVIWGGSTNNQVDSIYLVKSENSGRSFGEMKKIEETEQGKISNPLNVEIAVDENNRLFIAWQDKVETTATTLENEDIMSAVSLDGGESFESTTNISNNADTSECPSIAMNGDNIYITWEDLTPGNHEVLYRQGVLSI
jgi:BNR repeat-like domain